VRDTDQNGLQDIAVDLRRTDERYVLSADLPGVDPASIRLIVDSGALTIRARRTSHWGPTDDWIASERASGIFERHLILDGCVDAEQMRVGYHDGVLTVSIPVAERLARVAG